MVQGTTLYLLIGAGGLIAGGGLALALRARRKAAEGARAYTCESSRTYLRSRYGRNGRDRDFDPVLDNPLAE